VIFDHKALGCGCVVIEGTSGQLVDTVAATAVKMVVMTFAAPLVQRPHGGMADLGEPSFVEQQFEVSVDGGQVEGGNLSAGILEYLVDTQWAILVKECLLYR